MMSWFPMGEFVSEWLIQKVWKFATKLVFSYSGETEEESEEGDDDIDYDQVSSLINSKLLLVKIIQVVCSTFWTNLYSTESHHQIKWSRKKVWDWENKHNDY